jgi:hypothetical protein
MSLIDRSNDTPVSDWAALAGRSAGDIQTRQGVRVEGLAGNRTLAQQQLSDRDHRDQRDHREPRKTVAECRSAMSNA